MERHHLTRYRGTTWPQSFTRRGSLYGDFSVQPDCPLSPGWGSGRSARSDSDSRRIRNPLGEPRRRGWCPSRGMASRLEWASPMRYVEIPTDVESAELWAKKTRIPSDVHAIGPGGPVPDCRELWLLVQYWCPREKGCSTHRSLSSNRRAGSRETVTRRSPASEPSGVKVSAVDQSPGGPLGPWTTPPPAFAMLRTLPDVHATLVEDSASWS